MLIGCWTDTVFIILIPVIRQLIRNRRAVAGKSGKCLWISGIRVYYKVIEIGGTEINLIPNR